MGEAIMAAAPVYLDEQGNPTAAAKTPQALQYLDEQGNPIPAAPPAPKEGISIFAGGPLKAADIGAGLKAAGQDVWSTVKNIVSHPAQAIAGQTPVGEAYGAIQALIPAFQAYETARASGKGVMDSLHVANDEATKQNASAQMVQQRVDEYKKNPTMSMIRALGDAAALAAATYAGGKVIGAMMPEAAGAEAEGAAAAKPGPFTRPEPTPKPVATPVETASPLDDAVIRKSFDKSLDAPARNALRAHVGDTIAEGSSAENTLMKAIKPVNDVLAVKNAEMDTVLKGAQPLEMTPNPDVQIALQKFREKSVPGGLEETWDKAVTKETARAGNALNSTDPKEINAGIRELDKGIRSYTSPEKSPLATPSDMTQAVRVIIRRTLRGTLNEAIPETKPINTVLGTNMDLLNALRDKFGALADEPDEAVAQQSSELAKGQAQGEATAQEARVARNKTRLGIAAGALGLTGLTEAARRYLGL